MRRMHRGVRAEGRGASGARNKDSRTRIDEQETCQEYRLVPRGAWLDLAPADADLSTRLLFACLEEGALEAWQDTHGVIRFYIPPAFGGHLVIGGPHDDVEPVILTEFFADRDTAPIPTKTADATPRLDARVMHRPRRRST